MSFKIAINRIARALGLLSDCAGLNQIDTNVEVNTAQEQANCWSFVDSRNNRINISPAKSSFIIIDDGNVIYNKDSDTPTITRVKDGLRIKGSGFSCTCGVGTTVVICGRNVVTCAGRGNTINV